MEKIVEIDKKEIISVVGAGGKTSFITYLTQKYRNNLKVLFSTTTKIYKPDSSYYDNIYMINGTKEYKKLNENGVSVIGKYINNENKVIGLDFKDLSNYKNDFDLILIEADGSKKKPLKGWNEKEPVIYFDTTKTVGILDISTINKPICEKYIHRIEEFYKITSIKDGVIDTDVLKSIVLHKEGLFKNSLGKKVLFINKVENDFYEEKAKELINKINQYTHDIEIFYGSVKNEVFKYQGGSK